MKKLNKFFVFVLSLFCILGMVTPVFAEGEGTTTTQGHDPDAPAEFIGLHAWVNNSNGSDQEISRVSGTDENVYEFNMEIGVKCGISFNWWGTLADGEGSNRLQHFIDSGYFEVGRQGDGQTNLTNGKSGSTMYGWEYYVITPTKSGTFTYEIMDGITLKINITGSSSYMTVTNATGQEIKGSGYYDLNVGEQYNFTLVNMDNYEGEDYSLTYFETMFKENGNFEYYGGGADFNEIGFGIKPLKAGKYTFKFAHMYNVTLNVYDDNSYVNVSDTFKDVTVESGTLFNTLFPKVTWKNVDGLKWRESLDYSDDNGVTWKNIYVLEPQSGWDMAPEWLSSKESGRLLKLVCSVDGKDVYNKTITISVGNNVVMPSTTKGTPATTTRLDSESISRNFINSLSAEDKQLAEEAIELGGKANISVSVSKVTPSDADKKLVEAQLNSTNKVAMYLDLKVGIHILNVDGTTVKEAALAETGTPVQFTVALDDSFINTNNTVDRTYQVVRIHEGKVDVLPATFDPETKTITFESDKFSTYALMYTDTPKASKTPVTSDAGNVALYAGMGVVALAAVVAMIFFKKKNA